MATNATGDGAGNVEPDGVDKVRQARGGEERSEEGTVKNRREEPSERSSQPDGRGSDQEGGIPNGGRVQNGREKPTGRASHPGREPEQEVPNRRQGPGDSAGAEERQEDRPAGAEARRPAGKKEVDVISISSGEAEPPRPQKAARTGGVPKRRGEWRKREEGRYPCTAPGCKFKGWAEAYRRHQLNVHKVKWLAHGDNRLMFRKHNRLTGPGPDYILRDPAVDNLAAAMDDAGVSSHGGAQATGDRHFEELLARMSPEDDGESEDGTNSSEEERAEPSNEQKEAGNSGGPEREDHRPQDHAGGARPKEGGQREATAAELTVERLFFSEDLANFSRSGGRRLGEDLPEVAMTLEFNNDEEGEKCLAAENRAPGTAELPTGGGTVTCLECYKSATWTGPGEYRKARDDLRRHVNNHTEMFNAKRAGKEVFDEFLATARRIKDNPESISDPPTKG